MLKSVMNVLMVPVLGFALLFAVANADLVATPIPVDESEFFNGNCKPARGCPVGQKCAGPRTNCKCTT